jgi:hypothetical protein
MQRKIKNIKARHLVIQRQLGTPLVVQKAHLTFKINFNSKSTYPSLLQLFTIKS